MTNIVWAGCQMARRVYIVVAASLCLGAPATHGADASGDGLAIRFASPAEGAQILGARDEFTERMSSFDRASRMKTDRAVSEQEFLRFAAHSAQPWEAREREKVEAAFRAIRPRLAKLSVRFPKTVYAIKTTGAEEAETSYTRANAIVIPTGRLAAPPQELTQTLSHELFHILLRHDDKLRERLYRLIGFEKCNEVALPAALASRRITNPDAPRNDYRIRVQLGAQPVWAVPILYSVSEKYDRARGGLFFDYLQFRLLLVEDAGNPGSVKPMYDGTRPKLVEVGQVTGFFEQVGRNTQYVIHPEEILADNFTFLVLGSTDLPSPEIVDRLRRALSD